MDGEFKTVLEEKMLLFRSIPAELENLLKLEIVTFCEVREGGFENLLELETLSLEDAPGGLETAFEPVTELFCGKPDVDGDAFFNVAMRVSFDNADEGAKTLLELERRPAVVETLLVCKNAREETKTFVELEMLLELNVSAAGNVDALEEEMRVDGEGCSDE